ncbi:hypothetical protein FQA47_019374 [Oryzias melastigma]|uniref:Uncharacterized protein n=1 Tax=Oryzias melastigma TaxID=30732 RepID=A0A834F243_ORYME|nr:hypothetical protein FQA47_019374 [Oryzias melastigma]
MHLFSVVKKRVQTVTIQSGCGCGGALHDIKETVPERPSSWSHVRPALPHDKKSENLGKTRKTKRKKTKQPQVDRVFFPGCPPVPGEGHHDPVSFEKKREFSL